MPLRAKKPEAIQKRLKLFMFGPAGVGKTTAAIKFPTPYVIDAEKGTEHKNYVKILQGVGGEVFQTSDINDVIAEVRALLTEKHEFRTLVIDPITPIYNDLLEKCEAKVGSDFGRHYGAANKEMKRLANLILALDMNVIVTAHAKPEYGDNLKKLGHTFDGWKSLDYWFDLVLQLGRSRNFDGAQPKTKSKERFARVEKSRLSDEFPDMDVFEWSYAEFQKRYGAADLERPATTLALASPTQVSEIIALLNVVKLPDDTVEKWFKKANVDQWEDMPADTLSKCIDYVKGRLPTAVSAT